MLKIPVLQVEELHFWILPISTQILKTRKKFLKPEKFQTNFLSNYSLLTYSTLNK